MPGWQLIEWYVAKPPTTEDEEEEHDPQDPDQN